MFRWLLIVLLFALPAQFVSAAVASYCGHERVASSFHIGHHAHEHGGESDGAHIDTTQVMPDQPVDLEHEDCSACHANLAQLGDADIEAIASPHRRAFVGPPAEPFSSTIDQNIDRPKWARAG